jgi:hypothetical protein
MGSRNEGSYLTGSARKGIHKENSVGNFIPLRDLLKKNHEDRVQDYLKEMEEGEHNDEKNPAMNQSDVISIGKASK